MTTDRHPRPSAGHPFAPAVFVALAGVVAFLSFADRAPALVRGFLRAGARVADRVQRAIGVSVVDTRDVPFEWDLLGHFVLWATVAVVGWWTFRSRASATAVAIGFFVVSYLVEIGQAVLSTNRSPDVRDLVANALGIAVGMVLAVTVDAATRPSAPEPAR
ncbi:MAG: VanZ family protein [Actinomycetota bacterium]